jgi:hypothetical protein
VAGKLPPGLALRMSANRTATLTGKAARRDKGHTYRLVVTASNGIGPAKRQVIPIRVV